MRSSHSGIVITLSLAACATSPQPDGGAPPSPPSVDGYVSGSSGECGGSDSPQPMCSVAGAPGTIEAQLARPPLAGAAVLVANRDGELAYTAANTVVGFDGNRPILAQGVTRLDQELNVRFTYPYGTVVALDSHAHAFVAGPFTQPTDFGTGTITPAGNIDIFLVELSPTGQVLYATALGLCGDGLYDIAIARDHRIAISGDAFGTAVLDDHGTLLFQVPEAGKIAFDSRGELVIGGFTIDSGNRDALITKVDASGNERWHLQLGDAPLPVMLGGETIQTPQPQAIADIAIGPDDQIAALGAFRREMDLFGQTLYLPANFPSGPWADSFLVVLDRSGMVLRAAGNAAFNASRGPAGLSMSSPLATDGVALFPGTGIAFRPDGGLAISINIEGNTQPPFAYPQLTVTDAAGNLLYSAGNGTGTAGFGLGIATDACGNVYWADFENTPSIFDPHILLTKRAP